MRVMTLFHMTRHRPPRFFTVCQFTLIFCVYSTFWTFSGLFSSKALSSPQASSMTAAEETEKKKITTFRSDLASLLSSTLCQSHFSARHLHQAKELLSQVSFDAGAKLAYLNLRSQATQTAAEIGRQKKIKKTDEIEKRMALQTYAESQAQKEHHLGVAWGVCSSNHPEKAVGWIITTPSPYPWNHNHFVHATTSHCRSHELLMTTPAASPKPISRHQWQKAMEDKDPVNSVSFRCFPKHPEWLGPVMWFLKAPPPALTTADVHSLSFSGDSGEKPKPLSVISVQGIVTAISNIRRANRLPPLLHRQGDFDQISAQLATHHALTHHHNDLSRLASSLPREVKALTELRVIASSNEQALALLRASPSHRKAFMSPSARWINVNVRAATNSQSQVVMILGHN